MSIGDLRNDPYRHISVAPLAGALGAEIGGADLNALGDETVVEIRAALLELAGLMAIPPLGVEPAPYFALLAKLARRHDVTGLSIGMSGDFEAAVMLGATTVRVGTALFEDE